MWSRSVGPPGVHVRRGPIRSAIEGNDEALVAAPRVTHAEQLHRIEQRIDGLLWRGLEDDAEQSDAPVKSRFQIAWPGSSGRAGCKTLATSGRRASHRAMSIAACW